MFQYEQIKEQNNLLFNLFGNWVVGKYSNTQLPKNIPSDLKIILNFKKVKKMDTTGVLIITEWVNMMENQGNMISFEALSKQQRILFKNIKEKCAIKSLYSKNIKAKNSIINEIGRQVTILCGHFIAMVNFVGVLFIKWLELIIFSIRTPWKNIFSVIELAGIKALPLVTILAFLIGIVLAHQLGGTLKQFGANIFIANLLVISVFREFAPLITAIIVAGRTGCYFAAQIGTMHVNDELDALTVMGISVYQRIVLPKVLGLLIVLPLLTLWFSILAILGGMLMSALTLDVTYTVFIDQIRSSDTLSDFLLGQLKTPFYAFFIAIIGCYEGLSAKKSAASVGLKRCGLCLS